MKGQHQSVESQYNSKEDDIMSKTKPFSIEKGLVYEAYKRVKANSGGCGVDQQSLEIFEKNVSGNLYKLWNRLSSGSYFPLR